MRRFIAVAAVVLGAALTFAQPMAGGPAGMHGALFGAGPFGSDPSFLATALGDRKLGDLDGPALADLAKQLRTTALERAYVARASALSFMMPGAGQFYAGNPAGGAAFAAGQLAVVGGTLAGAYFLLPADLRFDSLNYFAAPISTIKTTWENHSIADYLPTMGIMAAGMIVDMPLRFFASKGAAADALAAVKAGKVNLETIVGPGFAGWRFRY